MHSTNVNSINTVKAALDLTTDIYISVKAVAELAAAMTEHLLWPSKNPRLMCYTTHEAENKPFFASTQGLVLWDKTPTRHLTSAKLADPFTPKEVEFLLSNPH
ncbi:hypothetical protein DUI87_31025 [Hirundo rustica rustica]|uniref:Uncharacterized protein n=1 Tax=Hirundo rustica rustica TaxID=333673 RepID=A0A3M0IT63_HIRRU|nr:hypothetical protein DUI87_31025 [Hirundo rustica rustica]